MATTTTEWPTEQEVVDLTAELAHVFNTVYDLGGTLGKLVVDAPMDEVAVATIEQVGILAAIARSIRAELGNLEYETERIEKLLETAVDQFTWSRRLATMNDEAS